MRTQLLISIVSLSLLACGREKLDNLTAVYQGEISLSLSYGRSGEYRVQIEAATGSTECACKTWYRVTLTTQTCADHENISGCLAVIVSGDRYDDKVQWHSVSTRLFKNDDDMAFVALDAAWYKVFDPKYQVSTSERW